MKRIITTLIVVVSTIFFATSSYAWNNQKAWRNTGYVAAGALGVVVLSHLWNHDRETVYRQPVYEPVYTPVYTPSYERVIYVPQPERVVYIQASPNPEPITVNIPAYNGGYRAVVLTRSGNGFIGPQGEYYAEFPSVATLQVMYGR